MPAIDHSPLFGAIASPDALIIPVDLIDFDEKHRLRPLNRARVAQIAGSMRVDGQISPLHVCRLPGRMRYTLVAGAHRLAAARLAGLADVRAEVVGAGQDERRLVEILENLVRSDLRPVEEAAFVAELVAIKKKGRGVDPAKDGRTASARKRVVSAGNVSSQAKSDARETTDILSVVYGWNEEVARECGWEVQKVYRAMRIHRGLEPAAVDRLRSVNHSCLKKQGELLKLVALPPAERTFVVDLLAADPALSVKGAIEDLRGKPVRREEDGRHAAWVGGFSRMSHGERQRALASLAENMTPALKAELTQLLGGGPVVTAAFPPEHERYRDEALASIDSAREIIDGLLEDEAVRADRATGLEQVRHELQLTRFTIAGDGFAIGPRS